jgi:NAD(P)-dependent dehydrogenase (short-subunit alcohol dehydrogenase family)
MERVVVFGCGGGLGSAICHAFSLAGKFVIGVDVDLEAARHAVRDQGDLATALQCDVSDQKAVQTIAQRIWQDDPVKAVVYAPGIVFTEDVCRIDWDNYRRLMSVNLDGAFYCASAFSGLMCSYQQSGNFVFFSSAAGKRGEPGASAYCASKFGLIGMVQSLAAEIAKDGIRVNAICPGNVDTPMLNQVARQISERENKTFKAVKQELVEESFSGRLVTSEEVANACVWLCSDAASGVTGISLSVDGGMLLG